MLYDNEAMINAKEAFATCAKSMEEASEPLISTLETVLSSFEGAAKDAVQEKIGARGTNDQHTLVYLVETYVPAAFNHLAEVIENNRQAMVEVDKQLAQQIRGME